MGQSPEHRWSRDQGTSPDLHLLRNRLEGLKDETVLCPFPPTVETTATKLSKQVMNLSDIRILVLNSLIWVFQYLIASRTNLESGPRFTEVWYPARHKSQYGLPLTSKCIDLETLNRHTMVFLLRLISLRMAILWKFAVFWLENQS